MFLDCDYQWSPADLDLSDPYYNEAEVIRDAERMTYDDMQELVDYDYNGGYESYQQNK